MTDPRQVIPAIKKRGYTSYACACVPEGKSGGYNPQEVDADLDALEELVEFLTATISEREQQMIALVQVVRDLEAGHATPGDTTQNSSTA